MDFAEVARRYPQFGKSTWNLGRSRGEVFSSRCKATPSRRRCDCAAPVIDESPHGGVCCSADPLLGANQLCEDSAHSACGTQGRPADRGMAVPIAAHQRLLETGEAAAAWRRLLLGQSAVRGQLSSRMVGIESAIELVRGTLLRNAEATLVNGELISVPNTVPAALAAARALGLISVDGISWEMWHALQAQLERVRLGDSVGGTLQSVLAELERDAPDASKAEWVATADQWCGVYDHNALFFPCNPAVPACIWRFLKVRGVDLTFGACHTDREFFICECRPKDIPGFFLLLTILILILLPEAGPILVRWRLGVVAPAPS